jgi:hypothetical protein
MNMLFLIHFEITPEARDNALKRLKASDKWEPLSGNFIGKARDP